MWLYVLLLCYFAIQKYIQRLYQSPLSETTTTKPWGNSLESVILLSTSWGRLFQAADPAEDPAELPFLPLYGCSNLLHVSSFLGPRPEGQNLHGGSFSCGAWQKCKLANSVTQTHFYPQLVWSLLTCKDVTWPSPK